MDNKKFKTFYKEYQHIANISFKGLGVPTVLLISFFLSNKELWNIIVNNNILTILSVLFMLWIFVFIKEYIAYQKNKCKPEALFSYDEMYIYVNHKKYLWHNIKAFCLIKSPRIQNRLCIFIKNHKSAVILSENESHT